MTKQQPYDFYSRQHYGYSKLYWSEDANPANLCWPNGFESYPTELYNIFTTIVAYKRQKNYKILDLGCGNGLLLKHLRDTISEPVDVYGIDFLEKSIDQAKNIIHEHSKDHFTCGNLLYYDFASSPFTNIFCNPLYILENQRVNFLTKLLENTTHGGFVLLYSYRNTLMKNNILNIRDISILPFDKNYDVLEFPEMSCIRIFKS